MPIFSLLDSVFRFLICPLPSDAQSDAPMLYLSNMRQCVIEAPSTRSIEQMLLPLPPSPSMVGSTICDDRVLIVTAVLNDCENS